MYFVHQVLANNKWFFAFLILPKLYNQEEIPRFRVPYIIMKTEQEQFDMFFDFRDKLYDVFVCGFH